MAKPIAPKNVPAVKVNAKAGKVLYGSSEHHASNKLPKHAMHTRGRNRGMDGGNTY
jgi:hypothetical protein